MQCKLLCGQLLPATLQSPINPDSLRKIIATKQNQYLVYVYTYMSMYEV